jgi:hypothetical protein
MTRHYLNLTNGIEALSLHSLPLSNVHFINVQSTACEQKRWSWLLDNLDSDLLIHLALGSDCIVYDGTAHGRDGIPRALWQGLEFVKYVLERAWLGRRYVALWGMSNYFDEVYDRLPDPTLTKLRQFRRYLATDELHLRVVTWHTDLDGNYEAHVAQIKEALAVCPQHQSTC